MGGPLRGTDLPPVCVPPKHGQACIRAPACTSLPTHAWASCRQRGWQQASEDKHTSAIAHRLPVLQACRLLIKPPAHQPFFGLCHSSNVPLPSACTHHNRRDFKHPRVMGVAHSTPTSRPALLGCSSEFSHTRILRHGRPNSGPNVWRASQARTCTCLQCGPPV